MTMLVGIAGVTGQFGELLALTLLENGVNIRGYCRNAAKVSQLLSSSRRVEIVQGDAYDRQTITSFVKGCEIVACCYQGEDKLMIEGQKALIDSCEAERVPRFMSSDWSLDYDKLEFGQLFTKDPMKHVKAYLGTKSFVKGVHVLNGIFFDTFFSPFFRMYDAETHTFSYWGKPDVLMEGTSYRNSAEYTTRVILDKTAVGTQRFVGDSKSMEDIAASFEQVYGVKAKVVNHGSAEELYKKMWEVRTSPTSQLHDYMSLFYQHYMINEQTYVGPDLNNSKYPEVNTISFEKFMQSVPLDQLPLVYQNPVSLRIQKGL